MKIAFVYPPPWKIAVEGALLYPKGEGRPSDFREGDLDADFFQIPYGLLALAAATIRAGHQVKVLNLSSFVWPKVEEVIEGLDADVFAMSCWTANRRGVALTAKAIRAIHPNAKVVIGGPHATPLGGEMLRHYPEIDVATAGESDVTFLELLDRWEAGESITALPGAFTRSASGEIVRGEKRANISELDSLACPQDYFATHILMTSRGCPWACTFCGAESSWGRGFRSNSLDYVLHAMEAALSKLPVRMLQIKDDTFTTNKKRVLELCQAIRERKLNFFWSCDTRVDLLTEELLREMRLAGCERLSLGVESGSQKILDSIDKKITVAEILESTRLAKKVGLKVRYFMMLGNRGETRATFDETLRFLEQARPHEYVFSCLSVYPGTKDFADAEKGGWLDREAFFKDDFQELKTPFDSSPEDTQYLTGWFEKNSGLRTVYREGVTEYRAILEALGDYHAAHMDLGVAYYYEKDFDAAERHVRRALELGYPLPGLAYNHLACFAKARGDLDGMMNHFTEAARIDPQHWVLIENVRKARAWFKANGLATGAPLELVVRHDFQLLERTMQPTLPGPLPDDFADWSKVPTPVEGPVMKTPEMEGSKKGLRLPVAR